MLTSLQSGRYLGGIGSLLNIIPVPFLSIIGIIMVFFGMRELSQAYNDGSIYRNTIYGMVFYIISSITGAFVWASFIFGMNFANVGTPTSGFIAYVIAAAVLLLLAFIFGILGAYFLRNAFNTLAVRSGVHLFRTSGWLLLISAILTIIIIGFFLYFITWILLLVSFFEIPKQTIQQPMPTAPPPVPPAP